MAARRAVQAKALASNSSSSATLGLQQQQQASRARIKSTSMTNLLAPSSDPQGQHQHQAARPIQRPASRNALDSIHKGMNAKFTHVQSKVLLQNIRPQQQQAATSGSKIPWSGSTLARNQNARGKPQTPTPGAGSGAKIQQSDRSQLINKIKALQEELAGQEQARDELKLELEREKADKQEQLAHIKLEIEEKARDAERQNEEYHQKLLEAYELADQNRRAADNVLGESRLREEELRKKIDELEHQLAELKEFVSMKEEMQSKMSELREQICLERERYEEKTRNLNQMFETEKISAHMRVDPTSNYFKRAKGSLQASELSIDRLGEPQSSQKQLNGNPNGSNETSRHHRSQSDIYGSKLSTRMQDGAKFAWKKSRKFASSVITGSLGGISACRKRDRTLAKSHSDCAQQVTHGNYVSANLQVLGAHVAKGGAIEVAPREIVVREQPHLFQPEVGGLAASDQEQQHTSVVEVQQATGEPQQQQQQFGASNFDQHQQQAASSGEAREQECKQQISVDENNKLTIVTKFNADCSSGEQPASTSSQSSSCERSRCESSSSGRGTSSDCGSSTSQNGDLERPKTPPSRTEARVAANNKLEAASSEAAEYQRHKRKSSLFKASEMLSGSQASLNKTFKSFFAGRKSSAPATGTDQDELAARQIPFDLANKAAFQEPPALQSFKQMGELARANEANNNDISQSGAICEAASAARQQQTSSFVGGHHDQQQPLDTAASQAGS